MKERRKRQTNPRASKIVLNCRHCPLFGKTEETCAMTSDVIPEDCPLPKALSMSGRIIVAKERKDDNELL